MTVPEAEILRPLDASNTNSDDWEIFVLSDARVVYESNGKPASLLAAYADTPLKVEGRLETPGRNQLKYLLKKPYKPTEIEIRNVTRFSYGEMTDGAYVMWAQGKAGWFEIRPTAAYKPIYDDMVQAVQLLYFVTDVYSESRKKGGGPSAELIFQEYAEDQDFDDCKARIEGRYSQVHPGRSAKSAPVLVPASTPTPAPTLQKARSKTPLSKPTEAPKKDDNWWEAAVLFEFIQKAVNQKVLRAGRNQITLDRVAELVQDFDDCKARIEGRYSQVHPGRSAKSAPVLVPASTPTPAPTLQKARSKTPLSKPTEAPKKDDNWWEAAVLFEFIQKAVNQKVLRAGRNQITLDRVAELVVRRYEIEELETAKNPGGHNLPAAEQRRAEGVELKPRKDHARLRDGESDSSDTTDEDEDEEEEDTITTPIRRPPGRRKKGRLSVLRPKSNRLSGKSKGVKIAPGKQKGGKGKAPIATSDDSGADQTEEATSSDADSSIQTPTQALSPAREKRKLDETDVSQDDESRSKRAASASLAPESPPTTSSSPEDDEEASAVPPLPLRYRPESSSTTSATKPTVAPRLVSTPLPTYEANGPRDSWICSFDGCTQKIYGCSKDLGRQLITEHLEDHSRGREKVVGILWREQDRLHLPVSNLIKKIREMSEAGTPLFLAEATATGPRPIKRPV
ncbi:Atrophin-1 multi-domain protein [Pyrenophora tritici-repentis]|uniref:Atrophin-1 multi-domain protein n=1 Tax=Pyrenophora tritici-repentis TaxID=45151 RepID=A0A834VQP0_9PLEO|nr:Atrophin-1 multi-domain protein [Pyrenophora tritici-repentis]